MGWIAVGRHRRPVPDGVARNHGRASARVARRGAFPRRAVRRASARKRCSSSCSKIRGSSLTSRSASCVRSVQTMEERLPVRGRMAKGPAGRKCSFGAAVVGALMGDRADDARLAVLPLRRCGCRPCRRRRERTPSQAITRRASSDRPSARCRRAWAGSTFEPRGGQAGQDLDAQFGRASAQCAVERAVGHHVRKRLTGLDFPVEGEEDPDARDRRCGNR